MNALPQADPCKRLIRLIYELLDAHDDTARIAAGLARDPIWQPHLLYLRDLQRLGREVVASAAVELEASSRRPRRPPSTSDQSSVGNAPHGAPAA